MDSENDFRHIKRVTIAEQVADQINDIIRSGTYKPGEKIPSQRELEEMMNISRPTLREAISRLISADILEAKQGQGYFVKQPSMNVSINCPLINGGEGQLRDLFEARLFTEASLAQLAAVFASDEEIAQLKDYLDRVEQGRLKDEEKAFGGNYLHLLIAKFSHNSLLESFEVSLLNLFSDYSDALVSNKNEDYYHKYELDPHRRIVDEIARRDPQAAYNESFIHIISYTNDIGIQEKYSIFYRGNGIRQR